MNTTSITALVADDEPLLRSALIRKLAELWPELKIVAQARNGREALEQFKVLGPDICFLDVHMPGISGIDAARLIARRAHIVFVTAFVDYAVQAFEHGALDYLVKPVETDRLRDTIQRLQERLQKAQPALNTEELIDQLAMRLKKPHESTSLRWIRALVGQSLHLIPVEKIDYLRSDDKYTLIAWRDDNGKLSEALVRTALKELLLQLDQTEFMQIHRSVVVNLNAISHVERTENETAQVFLKNREDVLSVSRSYLGGFKQM